MSTKDDIIVAVKAVADATGLPRLQMGLGEIGSYVTVAGERMRTGRTWEDNPSDGGPSPPVVQIEGLADYLDGEGVPEISVIKAKVNELIASYAQLKTDYDNGTVPTTAPDVAPIP